MSRGLLLYPAIDLRGGFAVRLERGDPGRETRYDADPVARARHAAPAVTSREGFASTSSSIHSPR